MCLDCRRELLEGDPLRITTQLLDGGRERPHIFQPMRHTSGEFLAATHEVLFARVRLEQRRACRFPRPPRRRCSNGSAFPTARSPGWGCAGTDPGATAAAAR
jgi:acyl-CoA thioesterase FadM